MESDAIQRNAVFVFVLFDLNAIRVVGTHLVQRKNVQYDKRKQHDGQRHHVQGKESVKCDTREQVVTADPGRDVFTHNRDRSE